jgi:hypothetical protein
LVGDGTQITTQFISDIHQLKPDLPFDVQVIINTTPALVFFDPDTKTVNLPFWDQLGNDSKGFFTQMGGSDADGKILFGLFFNGFYLPHELGHGLQFFAKGDEKGSYKNEFFANQVGLTWWRMHGETTQLEQCYGFAQHIVSILPDPVPKGMTIEQYFNENYDKVSSNPYIYGYMQFNQFIQIYEDKTLPEFPILVTNYLKNCSD